jgi:predicted kinase
LDLCSGILSGMSEKSVYMLVGAPGSGKSTLAHQLFPVGTEGCVLISSDGIRKELNGSEESQANGKAVWEEFYRRLDEAMGEPSVAHIILDATFYDRKFRKTALDRLGGRATVHALLRNPTLQEVLRRNSTRSRVVPEDVVTRMFLALNKELPEVSEGFFSVVNVDGDITMNLVVKGE